MYKLSLNGNWQLYNERTEDRYNAEVPGFVQQALQRTGVIPNEWQTLLESEIEWVEYEDWTYTRSFELSTDQLEADELELVMEGVDTYAEIVLNGHIVGCTDNMFIAHRFSIKPWAKPVNELVVRLSSPTRVLQQKEKEFGDSLQLWNGIPARLFGRKAQYGYGWDWGPRLVTIGIHKPVYVEASNGCRADKLTYQLTHLSDDKAILNASLTASAVGADVREAEVVCRLYEGGKLLAESRSLTAVEADGTAVVLPIELSKPRRWYPIGYGEQPLYKLTAAVTAGGRTVELSRIIGLREVKLLQPYDKQGRKFIIEVNGIPVLCKGVNWIPLTLYPGLDTAEAYAAEVSGIAEANMNMIRIWGGGYYENREFYEECDRLGIMVWQDFMFACGDYPDDDAFCELVRKEAQFIIDTCGHHPSIVLWCGNNENQHFVENSRRRRRNGYGEKLYFEVLGDVCAKDSSRPYWPTSPFSYSVDHGHNDEDYGDQHYWHVWGQVHPYENYQQMNGRFLSEFGMQSYPSMRVMDGVDREADLRDPKFQAMQKAPNGIQRLLYYTVGDYRLPANKGDFVYVNQLMQANALRLGVEHWIARMPDTSGALIWQWSDLWPSISWAIVDYSKVRKPSYYYMKRTFRTPNALLRVVQGEKDASLFLLHETGHFQGHIEVSFYDIISEREVRLDTFEANGQGCSATRVGTVSLAGHDPSRTVVFVRLLQQGCVLVESSYLIGKPYQLQLKPASIRVEQQAEQDGAILVTLTSDVFAKDVGLPNLAARLSDNYFDLRAGESRQIRIEGLSEGEALTPICLNAAIRTAEYI
ncbi:beta-mannosidase [Paenibacillus xylaniclasticus]|uniref:beta-mannosidase n=1 Tax=Paenibacillus xylaniclasticus TaxID=588083 RepID=UPI0013DEE0F3|nr:MULTISPECIES: glycoside hydrolase family 2 protein [Paenibacillus]GFN31106.1 beta-mannosidase [Paenibacillus curdlanolyticus]